MPHISILTLHFYDNFGSVLQGWALRHFLNTLPDCRAEIVPFRPSNIPDYQYFSDSTLQARFWDKQALFAEFRRDFMGLAEADGGDGILSAIDSEVCVAGSDIIWSREHAGLHPAYFLSFARMGTKRVAYAASQRLRPEDETLAAGYLPAFDAISVREAADVPLISKYARVPVKTALDPTLLLMREDYAPLERTPDKLPKEPYLLFYGLTHDPAAVDAANLLAKRFGLRLVHYLADYPAAVFPQDAECFAFCGPREFLTCVRNASLVFTNSYHGTIFSILYHRPFYTQVTRGGMSARAVELTGALGLETRRYGGWTDWKHASMDMDWSGADERLEALRASSQAFLRDAVKV